MATISDFTHNAMTTSHCIVSGQNVMTNVRSGHTPMSDMVKNPMVHTQIMIVFLFCQK